MKLNFKRAITRMIVKGYGLSILICMITFAAGIALLVVPLFSDYIYHESHLVAGLVAVILPVLFVIAYAIPTKKDRADGL